MQEEIPKDVKNNRSLPDGVYPTIIRHLFHGEHVPFDHYIRIVFYLPKELTFLTHTVFLPHKFCAKAQNELWSFCRAVGLTPEHLLRTPGRFIGRKLRIRTRRFHHDSASGVNWFSDVAEFLAFGSDADRNRELGMDMIPHSGLAN